jgi:hypothetical protein
MIQDKDKDKDEFDNAIKYFQSIMFNNITKYSKHKMGATFIGIKTNISGIYKLHFYILFFPFINSDILVPYINTIPNLYLKDFSFDVDESFYLWIYQEMKKQNSMVIMSLESNIFKVVQGFGDAIINIDNNCIEQKEWMNLEYEEWMEKQTFNNVFTITLTNPFLYMVPFPVKPIIIKTQKRNNYVILNH